MGSRFEECRYCVDARLTNNYGHCKYCRRTISSGGNPDRFRDVRVVDSTEKMERPKVPVMFDKLTLKDIHHDCYEELDIKNVIFNEPATIVFWTDGSKTVVKCAEGDEFDPEKGIAMAISKKIFGNQGSYYNKIKKWTKGEEEVHEVIKTDSLLVRLENMRKKAEETCAKIEQQYKSMAYALGVLDND